MLTPVFSLRRQEKGSRPVSLDAVVTRMSYAITQMARAWDFATMGLSDS